MLTRAAEPADVGSVVAMAHAMKRQLASWSPGYFRPRAGAEQRHEAFLAFLIGSEAHRTRVVVGEDAEVVGFFHLVPQPGHQWIDDVYLTDGSRWPELVRSLRREVAAPWVTCVSCFDEPRAAALRGAGLHVTSTYWARSVTGHRSARPLATGGVADPRPDGPRHTFGGTLFAPDAPGALVVVDHEGGYLIGSPGIEPPLYDPGGPTCVVDRVHGRDRGLLIDGAIVTAAARGDAGMVVVCDAGDDELRQVISRAGFRAEVDLFAHL